MQGVRAAIWAGFQDCGKLTLLSEISRILDAVSAILSIVKVGMTCCGRAKLRLAARTLSSKGLIGGMFVVGGTAPSGAGTLILAFSHQGRRDLLVAIRAWFQASGLVGVLWIPAFAGMTGESDLPNFRAIPPPFRWRPGLLGCSLWRPATPTRPRCPRCLLATRGRRLRARRFRWRASI